MNRLTIIGNLVADPELRITTSGKNVCTFTVAVNRRNEGADFFRVTTWDNRAEVCKKYLTKGKKVAVVGPVSLNIYTKQNGETGANLEITGNEVEFLSSGNVGNDRNEGFTPVDVDDNPFA